MVNYKIGVTRKKESRIIDFDKKLDLKKIDNLDKLTTEFNNEEELKKYLLEQGLINLDELTDSLSIMYRFKGKVKKLPIFYKDMKKYLDPAYLKYQILSLSNNIEFLEKLARYCSIGSDIYNPQGTNVLDIRWYINSVRGNGGNHFDSKQLSIALEDLCIKEIYKINKETGEAKINYRGLRDLANFVYKFKSDLDKRQENINDNLQVEQPKEFSKEEEYSQINMIDYLNEQKKILNKKKTQEEILSDTELMQKLLTGEVEWEQPSLFDMNFNENSEGKRI